jgi:hypothetical protein
MQEKEFDELGRNGEQIMRLVIHRTNLMSVARW